MKNTLAKMNASRLPVIPSLVLESDEICNQKNICGDNQRVLSSLIGKNEASE